MLSKVYGAGLQGIKGLIVCCEADIAPGLPNMITIGYLASEVKEAQDRVKTALKNSGYNLSPKKIVVNLSPANIKKEGCAYDLPIALAILSSYEIINSENLKDSLFIGELSLGGNLLPIRGILSITIAAKEAGFKNIYMPYQNAKEGASISGINCYGIHDLTEIVNILNGKIKIDRVCYEEDIY